MAPPHEKVFEPNSRLMDLFRRKSRMFQPSPGSAFKLPVMGVPDNPRHRIGSVLRIGRLSRMATFGHARRNPFFQLVASNARNSFTGVIAFLFRDLDFPDAEALPEKRHKDPLPSDLGLHPPFREQFHD